MHNDIMMRRMIHGVRIGTVAALALAGTVGLMTDELWSAAAGAGLMALAMGGLRRWGQKEMGLWAGRLWHRCEELMTEEENDGACCDRTEERQSHQQHTADAPYETADERKQVRFDAHGCSRVSYEFK